MWVLGVLGILILAMVVAIVAESKGYSPLLWFFVGLAFPLIGLVVVAVMPAAAHQELKPPETPAEAALRDPVARELGTHHIPVTPGRLAAALGISEGEVETELGRLRGFGLAEQDEHGRWALSEAGRFAEDWLGLREAGRTR